MKAGISICSTKCLFMCVLPSAWERDDEPEKGAGWEGRTTALRAKTGVKSKEEEIKEEMGMKSEV